jgi:hypothetical protein
LIVRPVRFLALPVAIVAFVAVVAISSRHSPGGSLRPARVNAARALDDAHHLFDRTGLVRETEGPNDMYALRQLGGLDGVAPSAAQLAAIGAQSRAVRADTRRNSPKLAAPGWHWVGPPNIGGRVTDIVADPDTKDLIYVAAASGGIWKSTDGGMNYSSIWPKANPQSIGALTMGKDGTLWAGTGEANPGGGSIT